jgi:hypothetical protein
LLIMIVSGDIKRALNDDYGLTMLKNNGPISP